MLSAEQLIGVLDLFEQQLKAEKNISNKLRETVTIHVGSLRASLEKSIPSDIASQITVLKTYLQDNSAGFRAKGFYIYRTAEEQQTRFISSNAKMILAYLLSLGFIFILSLFFDKFRLGTLEKPEYLKTLDEIVLIEEPVVVEEKLEGRGSIASLGELSKVVLEKNVKDEVKKQAPSSMSLKEMIDFLRTQIKSKNHNFENTEEIDKAVKRVIANLIFSEKKGLIENEQRVSQSKLIARLGIRLRLCYPFARELFKVCCEEAPSFQEIVSTYEELSSFYVEVKDLRKKASEEIIPLDLFKEVLENLDFILNDEMREVISKVKDAVPLPFDENKENRSPSCMR